MPVGDPIENRWTTWLYIASLTLFVAHGIDSTRFAEWDLFRMSPETYVISYLGAMAVLLYGLVATAQGLRNGYQIGLLLGLMDTAALAVHGPQIVSGTAFDSPLSIALILWMLVAGIALVAFAGRHLIATRTRFAPPPAVPS